ncbi:MAG: hypothetical protein OCU16_01570 [Candidatus Methanospirare jalkutatii]|nr:hypothetical protein [Candidatus Methanospirare jalkutatii]
MTEKLSLCELFKASAENFQVGGDRMRGKGEVSRKRKGFTGLEAAIVLTAFVVVAAVFSYVVLNAGFFTTQKSKEVVHTGVEQATSSVELAGDVIGYGWKKSPGNDSGNRTLGFIDTGTFYDLLSLTSASKTYVKAVVDNGTAPWWVNVSVTYKNDTNTYTTYINVTNTNSYADWTDVTTSIFNNKPAIDITNIEFVNWHNVTSYEIYVQSNGTYTWQYDGTQKSDKLTIVKFYLQLTAGEHPMDMDGITLSYADSNTYIGSLEYVDKGGDAHNMGDTKKLPMQEGEWTYYIVGSEGYGDSDNLLELGEKAEVTLVVPEGGVSTNEEFQVEVKPASGATLTVKRKAPSAIDYVMTLH